MTKTKTTMIPPPLGYTVPTPAHIWVGSIAENDSYNLCFYCAKFDAFTPKCTIHITPYGWTTTVGTAETNTFSPALTFIQVHLGGSVEEKDKVRACQSFYDDLSTRSQATQVTNPCGYGI